MHCKIQLKDATKKHEEIYCVFDTIIFAKVQRKNSALYNILFLLFRINNILFQLYFCHIFLYFLFISYTSLYNILAYFSPLLYFSNIIHAYFLSQNFFLYFCQKKMKNGSYLFLKNKYVHE